MFRVVPASVLEFLLRIAAYGIWYASLALHRVLKLLGSGASGAPCSKYAGKTVLVTTGRQAKTLHGVRALKELGCRIVVTDYQPMSASAVSTACDARAVLKPLDPEKIGQWVDHLEEIIVREKVDLVVPMSTINEALFIGVAKDWLARRLPHVQFLCEGLEMMTRLDNKPLFAEMCKKSNVPVPEDGVVSSRRELEKNVPFGEMDIILKRVESTINREEEIKIVPKGGQAPDSVQPSARDPWQWQRFIKGTEYSAWFVAVDGKITFQGCYRSENDLLFFDGIPVPCDVEAALEKFIAEHKLTGQYAFDFFREHGTGKFFIIECNPRASSVLEGVSGTRGWGASFFGEDMRAATEYQKVGFWLHRNCWPFVGARSEGFWCWSDPLPVLVAEVAWPLEMLRIKGALKGGALQRAPKGLPLEAGKPLTAQFPGLCEALGLNYHHLDVNIGKIIVPGRTVGRDYALFEEIQQDPRAAFVRVQAELCGLEPRVLCSDASVARALKASASHHKATVTCIFENPMDIQLLTAEGLATDHVIPGSPRSTARHLSELGLSFDAIFFPEEHLAELPTGLLAPGGRFLSLESLPEVPLKAAP